MYIEPGEKTMATQHRGKIVSENFLREFAFIIFYRKKTIVVTTLVIFLISILAAIFLPPTFVSSAKYTISLSQQLDPLKRDLVYDTKNQLLRVLQGQKEIVLSATVLQQTARKLFPQAAEAKIPTIAESLKKRISVTPPKGEDFEGSNVFYLNAEGKTPQQAYDLAKILSTTYLDTYAAISQSRSGYSYKFYNAQVEQLNKEMQSKSRKLREFEVKHASRLVDILSLEVGSGKTNVEIGPKALLTESLRNRQRLTEQYQAQSKIIDVLEAEAAKNTIPVVMADMEGTGKALTSYRNKVTQIQLQLGEMRTQYTGNYEPLQQLQKELQSSTVLLRNEFNAIIKAKKIELDSLTAQIKAIDTVIDQLEKTLTATARERSTYDALKQDYTLARDAYADARSKMEQARMAASINQEKQDISPVDEPELPLKPAKPNRPLLAVVGLVTGLFFGLALALTMDYFDHTLKTPEAIEQYLRLPCLGSVGRIS